MKVGLDSLVVGGSQIVKIFEPAVGAGYFARANG